MNFKQIIHRFNRRDLCLFPKISSPLKISILILLVLTTILTTKTIFAQQESNPLKKLQDATIKGGNQESWINNATGAQAFSLQLMTAGTFPDFVLEGKTNPPGQPIQVYIPGGIIGTANQVIASTYTPMASGVEYVAQLKNNFLGKPAYAADKTGFDALANIMNLWKMSRNVVYVLISLYFVVLGIMIMLRVKISPQAVVTVQSSLPKVITTLILVTFSYAIAGLSIDLINFIQPFAIALLFKSLGTNLNENLFPLSWGDWSISGLINFLRWLLSLGTDNAFDYNALIQTDFWAAYAMVQRLVPNLMILILGTTVGAIIGGVVGGTVPVIGLAGAAGGAALGSIVTVLVVSIVVLIFVIKLLFGLMKCYITIIFSIIFAPFQIFIGVFPNSKSGFSKWITTLAANLVVFPMCTLFLILANILSQNIHGGLWAPRIITGPVSVFLPVIFGISAIGMVSKLPQLITESVFNIKPSPFGKAIGESFTSLPGYKTATGGIKEVAGRGIGTAIIGSDNSEGLRKYLYEAKVKFGQRYKHKSKNDESNNTSETRHSADGSERDSSRR